MSHQLKTKSKKHSTKEIGLALGAFDFCHEGHINFLKRAVEACNELIIGIHTDEEIYNYKGQYPQNNQNERLIALRALNIAKQVEIFHCRKQFCKDHQITIVFHGDDCSEEGYCKVWGETLISELNINIKILPHTPNIHSTHLREQTPPIGWWLYTPNPDFTREHIFDHIKDLYKKLGGVWFVSLKDRKLIRKHFPNSPCALIEDGTNAKLAPEIIKNYSLDVLIITHFNYKVLFPALSSLSNEINLVVLSHGRSGKHGTSAHRHRKLNNRSSKKSKQPENVIIHDWSYDNQCYTHMDSFINNGGRFTNPIPKCEKPRILIISTWHIPKKQLNRKLFSKSKDTPGLLHDTAWAEAFQKLADRYELIFAPHPISDKALVQRFLHVSGAKLLKSNGRSFENVPEMNCIICDLSGAFWESMLFDTPVILAVPNSGYKWPSSRPPKQKEVKKIIPFTQADNLAITISKCINKRVIQQRAIAEKRLGSIDGKSTQRVADRIKLLISHPL